MFHIFLLVRSTGRGTARSVVEGPWPLPIAPPSSAFAKATADATSPLLRNREDIDAMHLDGYAGWIGLAVVIIGIIGGVAGRWRKK